jgi:hypothetical protein
MSTKYVYVPSKKHRNTPPDDLVTVLRRNGASREDAIDTLEYNAIMRDTRVALSEDDISMVVLCRRARKAGLRPADAGDFFATMQRETGLDDNELWESIEELILNGFLEMLSDEKARICLPQEAMQKQRDFAVSCMKS